MASTSWIKPARAMYTLPPPPSSAGVPYTRTVPLILLAFIQSITEMPAATEAAPKRWCPQACPAPPTTTGLRTETASWDTPGSASNSAMIPITGLPDPYSATKAVGIPATPAVTLNPASERVF